jgi:hypothetical protein
LLVLAATLGILLAGCGVNNGGDPVAPTRALVAPAPAHGHADTYCVEEGYEDDSPSTCTVLLDYEDASLEDAIAWWYRAADAVRPLIGTWQVYDGIGYRYDGLALGQHTSDGWSYVGWRCRGDEALTADAAADAALARGPLDPGGFRSAAAARAAGCSAIVV